MRSSSSVSFPGRMWTVRLSGMPGWLRAVRIFALGAFLLFLVGYGFAPDQVPPFLIALFLGCFLLLLPGQEKLLRIALRLVRGIGVLGVLFASVGILVAEDVGVRLFILGYSRSCSLR